jgi:hypothetical protein
MAYSVKVYSGNMWSPYPDQLNSSDTDYRQQAEDGGECDNKIANVEVWKEDIDGG